MKWPRVLLVVCAAVVGGCLARPGSELARAGDEIVVAGRYFRTGTPVVLWIDPGGYDGYRVEKRFVAWEKAGFDAWKGDPKGPGSPERFGLRFAEGGRGPGGTGERLDDATLARVRGGGWTLEDVQRRVDQFVLHYDACGCSRQCFNILHDHRGLSVHFMLDIDGTIYQTLDVKERAWHATTSNDRSVGVEIASPGAMAVPQDAGKAAAAGWVFNEVGAAVGPPPKGLLGEWYAREADGSVRLVLPKWLGDGGVRTREPDGAPFVPRVVPAGAPGGGLCITPIQGQTLAQYPYTAQQRAALVKLTATLCQVLPGIRPECPRDADGRVSNGKLPDDRLAAFAGVLGHYHITPDKIDPGPALDFEALIGAVREELEHRR
ncbi:MAG: N-acetylmuramoyl-L-alanine amidase [Phycisphaerales bacterium]|nr:N-acetylmuramoyl-L-alanine amidase [Phycisphaerales bacterium]